MKSSISILVALFFWPLIISGQERIESLPIRSQDELRNHALDIAKYGTRYFFAESIDWTWTNTVTATGYRGRFAEEVLKKFSVLSSGIGCLIHQS